MSRPVQRDPRPWHPLLSPLVPVLALAGSNLGAATWHGAVWPLTIALAGVLVVWAAVARSSGNRHTSALAVTVLTTAVLSHATVARAAASLGVPYAVVGLYVMVAVGSVALLRARRAAAEFTRLANLILVIMTVLLASSITWNELNRSRAPQVVRLPIANEVARAEIPDVYLLILDGYGRADVLREHYAFDNSLIAELKALGFFIAEEAASNYAQTAQSMASSLNLDYLPALLDQAPRDPSDRRVLGDLIRGNRMFGALRAAGYRIRSYESEYALVQPRPADERPRPFLHFTDFGYALYEGTALPPLLDALRLPPSVIPLEAHRRQLLWTLDHLTEHRAAADAPTFVFAHILMPHPPFVFNADGSRRATRLPAGLWDGDHWRNAAHDTAESYAAGYRDAVTFLNHRLLAIVRTVIERSTRPTIFYIQSDHGPGSQLHWEDPSATDMRERFGIMLAVRFPDADYSSLHARVTPVNASRALLNHVLGTDLPPVDDRSYFSRWNEPFEWLDVTGQLVRVP